MRRAYLTGSLLLVLLLPTAAQARWYGSDLRARPNTQYGCSQALTMAPLGGVTLSGTGQRSCTYRSGGYLSVNRPFFLVPRSGRIRAIRLRSGPHPAKVRLTILTASNRVDTLTGQDIPGTYTCCTARYVGRAFRPRANRITTRKVDQRVFVGRSRKLRYRIRYSDGLALSFVGGGRLPLHVRPDVGSSFATGTPITLGFWPRTRVGDPRVDAYAMTGLELLFAWKLVR